MPDETDTSILAKDDSYKGNSIFGVGIRAWITLIFCLTVCIMQGFILWEVAKDPNEELRITEPLYSLVLIAVGYYFGQKNPQTKT